MWCANISVHVCINQYNKSHLRGGLQIVEGNDFFVAKKLNGLLLPVIHIAVQLVRVHSCTKRKRKQMLSIKTKMQTSPYIVMQSPTSSELQAHALLFLIVLEGFLSVATVVFKHGSSLVHQFL